MSHQPECFYVFAERSRRRMITKYGQRKISLMHLFKGQTTTTTKLEIKLQGHGRPTSVKTSPFRSTGEHEGCHIRSLGRQVCRFAAGTSSLLQPISPLHTSPAQHLEMLNLTALLTGQSAVHTHAHTHTHTHTHTFYTHTHGARVSCYYTTGE